MNQTTLSAILTLVALGLVVVGLISMVFALKHRTSSHPTAPSFNPRYWLPFWKWRQLYSPKGYRLALFGSTAVGLGALIALLRRLL